MPAQALINRAIAAQVMDIDYHIAWTDGMVLNQLIIRRTDAGWQVIIKGSNRNHDLVSYIDTRTFQESLELAGEMADNGSLRWSKDKYPGKVTKRPFPDLRR